MPTEVVARFLRSAVAREAERQLADLAAARWPDVRPVPMAEHLASLPAIVPDPDDDGTDPEPDDDDEWVR
jgi:hypothetical protein